MYTENNRNDRDGNRDDRNRNGNGFIRMVQATKLSVSTVLLLMNLFALIAGFGLAYGVFTTRTELQNEIQAKQLDQQTKQIIAVETQLNELRARLDTAGGRLIGVETDIKYITQGVAELKLLSAPKR